MDSLNENQINHAQSQDTWFQTIDPMTPEEIYGRDIDTRSILYESQENEESASNQEQILAQAPTPQGEESAPKHTTIPFGLRRIRDSISIYKDRRSSSDAQAFQTPDTLHQPASPSDEASDDLLKPSRKRRLRSRAVTISKAIAEKAAHCMAVNLLCSDPDGYMAPPSRVVDLPANASMVRKLKRKFWIFVDGESRYQPPATDTPPHHRMARTASQNMATNNLTTAVQETAHCKNQTNTPEGTPLGFKTKIWSPPRKDSIASYHSSYSHYSLDEDADAPEADKFEWLRLSTSPRASQSSSAYSECQTTVKGPNELHSQHSGWDLRGSSVPAMYERSCSRDGSWADVRNDSRADVKTAPW